MIRSIMWDDVISHVYSGSQWRNTSMFVVFKLVISLPNLYHVWWTWIWRSLQLRSVFLSSYSHNLLLYMRSDYVVTSFCWKSLNSYSWRNCFFCHPGLRWKLSHYLIFILNLNTTTLSTAGLAFFCGSVVPVFTIAQLLMSLFNIVAGCHPPCVHCW